MTTKEKILEALKLQSELSVKELVEQFQVSKQMIHRALIQLINQNLVQKQGLAPKTFYKIREVDNSFQETAINYQSSEYEDFLQKNFLLITELGEIQSGVKGFATWSKNRQLPLEKTILEFIQTKKKYEKYYDKNKIIDGTEELNNTAAFEEIFLDSILYLDFYVIERFGKTRLGTLLHFAKQGQNKYLMNILQNEIKHKIETLLKSKRYDAVGFVPPTIRREVQIMKYLQTHLKINLPHIAIQKTSGIIPVPQKSLSKIEERINNASNTFAVTETVKYKHILLIDDAVGSGATMNQIAGKIKAKKIATKVTGLAIVGNFKGFDVITDI